MRYFRIFSVLTITDLVLVLASSDSVETLHFGRSKIFRRGVDSGIDNRPRSHLYSRELLSEVDQFSPGHLLIPRVFRPPPHGNPPPSQKPGTAPSPPVRGNTPPPTRSGTPPLPPNAESPTLSSLPRANTWPLRERSPQPPGAHGSKPSRPDRSTPGASSPNIPMSMSRSDTPPRANTPPLPGHNTPSSHGGTQPSSGASSAASRAGSISKAHTSSHAGTSAFSSEAHSHPPSRASSLAAGASTPPRTRTPSPQRVPLSNPKTPPNQRVPFSAPWAPRRNVMRPLGSIPVPAWPDDGLQYGLPDYWPYHR